RKEGHVKNPVSFTSAEILRLLHKHRHSGKNYREIEEWLDVLFSTTIFSEGVVYLAGEKRRVKDRYRVFDRAVSFGKELSDYKVVFHHGEKFHRDRSARQNRKRISNSSTEALSESYQYPRRLDREHRRQSSAGLPGMAPLPAQQQFDPALVSEITRRGINEKK